MAAPDSALLLDTHVIVWMATGDPRLGRIDQAVLGDASRALCVSAVTAFELADLQRRGRIAMTESLDFLREHMDFRVLDFPADAWRIALELPPIHRDPVDRMLVAHALAECMTVVTADETIRRYPVSVA